MKKLLPFLLSSECGSDIDLDTDKTNSKIDKLLLMVRFISVIESEEKMASRNFGQLKSWLSKQLKRKITYEEEIALLEGIADYLHSDPGIPERMKAMNYLFNAEFIEISK